MTELILMFAFVFVHVLIFMRLTIQVSIYLYGFLLGFFTFWLGKTVIASTITTTAIVRIVIICWCYLLVLLL